VIVGFRMIAEGGRIPRGYGVAWVLPQAQALCCLPIPLNRVAGSVRNWWLRWRRPCENDPVQEMFQHGYWIGYQRGRADGETATYRRFQVLMNETLNSRTKER